MRVLGVGSAPLTVDGDFSPSSPSDEHATVGGMTFLGADTDQLRSTAESFSDGSQRLEELFAVLVPLVQGVEWVGPDAEAFRAEFDEAHRRGTSAARDLERWRTRLDAEGEEQDSASEADGAEAGSDGRGAGSSPSGPSSPGQDGSGLPDWVEKALGIHQGDGVGRTHERMGGGGWPRLLMKALPFAGALPEVQEFIQHVQEGESGMAIGDIGEIVVGAFPNPIVQTAGSVNGLSPAFMPEGKSLLEWGGEIEANGFVSQGAEITGSAISMSLGYEEGSTGDNVIRSSAVVGSYILTSANPILGAANSLTGMWNTFR